MDGCSMLGIIVSAARCLARVFASVTVSNCQTQSHSSHIDACLPPWALTTVEYAGPAVGWLGFPTVPEMQMPAS
ncbi:hypothetical protein B0T22DRAFT_470502 [Podospora appendiculata]|uniref:Secreted protein n=1 Tax=Podospora appendiculata TaxID=314037 RepID=A0AAE1C7U3_9PEZI|nr:hypothetical protein B0T22DRAFT_470502 [Podospora appendiculata]